MACHPSGRSVGRPESVVLCRRHSKIRSALGGNLRLRAPNELKRSDGTALEKAAGENSNPFYQIKEIPAPIVSAKATVTPPELKPTRVYDIATKRGMTYTFLAN